MKFDSWIANPESFIECLIDPDTNKPFVLLKCERTFIANMFRLDADGKMLFPDLIYSAGKKTGKTTFGAILVITMIVLFGGRNAEGYCCANDYDQAEGRVFEMCKRIILATPFLKDEVKITAGRIVFIGTNSIITAIPSDAASAAGGAPTITVFDEIWGMRSERARRLRDEMVYTPTRKVSCRLVVSYAGFSGESELLEELYHRGLALPEIGPDLRAGEGLLCFWTHTPQAPWQDERWLAQMRRSLRPTQYLRMIENRFVGSESSFIPLEWWDACVDPELRSVVIERYLPVWIGVDASVKRDSTALVCVTWSAKDQQVRLVNHTIIKPTADNPIDFEATIEQVLLDWHKRFNIRGIFYDPYQMVSSSQRLTRAGLPMVEFTQTVPNLTEAAQNLYDLIRGRNFKTYPNEETRLAVSRAVAIESSRGWRIGKLNQQHHIDFVVALAMAALSAVKQDAVKGSPLSTWIAAFNPGAAGAAGVPLPDPDGSTQWRDKRAPPVEWGPNQSGATDLGDNGYSIPSIDEQNRAALGIKPWDMKKALGRE
jgi:phage terminase large subunit-like protein